MKFKVDENLPTEIAALLRSANHDAITVTDQGLNSADDNVIMDVLCW
jgi:predicted nuclease of predicted toxin-antitoxin system